MNIIKSGPGEWRVYRGEMHIFTFKKLSWARAYVRENADRRCPCGAITHLGLGLTLPCFEGSDECLPCQNATLERMTATVYNSKW